MSKALWLTVILVLGVMRGIAYGQTGNANLSGSVRDASGAVIPDARVTVTNAATGVSREIQTNNEGIYVMPGLIPGSYSIKVRARGFQQKVISGIRLLVDQQARVDVTLAVGSVSESVTVSGSSVPLLQTRNASVGSVISASQVVNIPLNGRYFTQLLELVPGTVPAPSQGATSSSGYIGATQRNGMPVFDVNGQSGAYTMYRIDGTPNAEHNFGGAAIPLSPDAIQEFNLQTSNFSAQYGRSAVQVDIVSKSGTNQIHGDAYEFVRNDAFDAEQWSYTGAHEPLNLKRNQFGGTIGGPIKRDKLFYFLSYDGTRQVTTAPQTVTVPSSAMRDGQFPASEVIFNPATGLPFPSNTIPQADFNPISQKILQLALPVPNLPGVTQLNQAGLPLPPIGNYFYNPRENQAINQYNGRIDYDLSQRNTLFFRYTYSSNNIFAGAGLAPGVRGIVGGQTEVLGAQNLGAGWYHDFSPRTINQVTFGLLVNPDRYNKFVGPGSPSAAQLGMAQFLPANAYPGLPTINIGCVTLSSGDYRPLQYGDTDYLAGDNLTMIRGTHALEFGGRVQRSVLQEQDGEVSDGRFSFNGAQTRNRLLPSSPTTSCGPGGSAQCISGDPMADFLLGDLSAVGVGTPIPLMNKYFSVWSGYINDTWQARNSLTLDVGLRYDYNTRFHENPVYYSTPIIANGEFTGKVAVATSSNGRESPYILPQALAAFPGVVETCVQAGLPSNCMISEKHDWQPRFGFAQQIGKKNVLRGAFGMFYGYLEGYVETEQGDQWPMVNFENTQTYTQPPADLLPPPLSLSAPFASAAAGAPFFNNNGAPYRGLPAVYEWNLTGQRALANNMTLSVGYVASVSRHLENAANNQGYCCWFNIPQPIGVVLGPTQQQSPFNPNFGAMTLYEDNGNASFESLQVNLERRASHGLAFTADYTYSQNLYIQPGMTDPRYPRIDRGPWDDNLTHNFVFSPIWQLPLGAGQRWANVRGPLDALIGGWEASSVISIHSGFPFTPELAGTDLLLMNGFNGFDTPDRLPNCSGRLGNPTVQNWYNKSCFVIPNEPTTPGALLREGDAQPNLLAGPGAWAVDVGLMKHFKLSERYDLEFRSEYFNLFNHPVFGLPDDHIEPGGNSGPGVITSVVSQPRIIQFALKLHF